MIRYCLSRNDLEEIIENPEDTSEKVGFKRKGDGPTPAGRSNEVLTQRGFLPG